MNGTNTKENGLKLPASDTWWYSNIENLPEATRLLFEKYSGIPPENVIEHIQKMRVQAFKIFPFPCIGQLRYLNLSLSRHYLYPEIISRLQQNPNTLSSEGSDLGRGYKHTYPQKFLDIGCCMGQDVRKLAFDGVPSENLYGLDRDIRFVDIGYDLFQDRDTLKSKFVIADMMADYAQDTTTQMSGEPLADSSGFSSSTQETQNTSIIPFSELNGQISIIGANSFFHLANWCEQLQMAKNTVRLLAPIPGSLILGRQVGSLIPGEYNSINEDSQAKRYAHNVESFCRFWDQVACEVGNGCKFRVEAHLDEEELGVNRNQGQSWSEPNIRRLVFAVWRE